MLASFLAITAFTLGQAAAPVPNLAGVSNYGVVTQTGTSLTITGHRYWSAVGSIRADGKVQLLWTDFASGDRVGLSVYRVTPQGLRGAWGWGDETRVDARGELEILPGAEPDPDEDEGVIADDVIKIQRK